MNSTSRVILTVSLCVGLLIVWQFLFPPPKPPPAQPRAEQAQGDKGQGDKGQGDKGQGDKAQGDKAQGDKAQGEGSATSAPAASKRNEGGVKAGTAPGPMAEGLEGNQVTLKAEGASATFTDTGGALRHWVLDHPRYKEFREGKLTAVDVVQTEPKKGPWQLLTTFPDSGFEVPARAKYELVKQTEREVLYAWSSDKVRVSKHYVIDKTRPVMWLTVSIKNLGKAPIGERLRVELFAHDSAKGKPGIANPYPRIPTGLCFVNQELQRRSVGAITGEQSGCTAAGCGMGEGPVTAVGEVAWIGSDDRYFITALVPRGEDRDRRCELKKLADQRIVQSALLFAETKLAPGQTRARKFTVFIGAKNLPELDAVKGSAGGDPQLSKSIEFGWFAVLCRPMLGLLKLFFGWFGNWGIAIILLTIIVKLLTLYPTHKSMRSMKAMQKIKPKMDALRAKYGEDKQRLNQEMMALYKTHKVNPFGGCLPMLIQMPIWFALYRTLGNAVELYRSPFFGWITDLTAPDQYYVLPIAMGISMFGQQLITPQPMEGAQAKMMKYFMPGMFTVMMLWLPAGLTLYIFVNTVLTMLHQFHMNRSDPDRKRPKDRSEPAAEPPAAARPAGRPSRPVSSADITAPTDGGQRPKKTKKRRKRTKKS